VKALQENQAIILKENELSELDLNIRNLLKKPLLREKLAKNIQTYATKPAADIIADKLMELLS